MSPMSLFGPLFGALNAGGVRYLVVGGVATVLHGYPRTTLDVDLIVDLEPSAARKAIEVLVAFGLRPLAPVDPVTFADPEIRSMWIRDKGMKVFSLWDPAEPLRPVDLFVEHPLPFEALWNRSVVFHASGQEIRAVSLDDLIHLKRLAGRPKDLEDIEVLQAVKEERAKWP